MTQPRSKLVNLEITRWYHCISRCVRSAFLLSHEKGFNRKDWIQNRLKELESIFAISVAGFSLMDNHMHLLLRIDDDVMKAWTNEEVAARWLKLYPPRVNRKRVVVTPEIIAEYACKVDWVNEKRSQLASLGWFMKCLKEPFSRMVNREENCRGTFFEGRFKSIGILDEESLLTVAAYIDLNPFAAGIVPLPEQSPHTSIKERVENIIALGKLGEVSQIRVGSVQSQKCSEGIEEYLWLVPIEDRRRLGASRPGIKEGFTLAQYLMLLDCSSRMVRNGKKHLPSDVISIFERLDFSADRWADRLQKMVSRNRLYGNFMSSSPTRLQSVAKNFGAKYLVNTA